MSTEYFTYSSRLPEGLQLNPETGLICGFLCSPASFRDPSCDGEADTPIIIPGPGELSPTSSAALPIPSHDVTGETITWSFSSPTLGVSLNSQTGVCSGSLGLPD